MNDFLSALSTTGVAPWSVLLVAAILYWFMVIVGALDLDPFHLGEAPSTEHGSDHGHDGDPSHSGGFSGLFEFLSIGKVPVTIIASIFVFSGWSLAMANELLLPLWWPFNLAIALIVGFVLTGYLSRPLRMLFKSLDHGVETGLSLLGREARITSATCDEDFGTATCAIDGHEILLRVVVARPGVRFRRDEVVVIADYDPEQDYYRVGAAAYRKTDGLAISPKTTDLDLLPQAQAADREGAKTPILHHPQP